MKRRTGSRIRAVVLLTAAALTLLLFGTAVPAAADFPDAWIKSWLPHHRCLDVDSDTAGNLRTNVQLYDCRRDTDPLVWYQIFDKESIPGRPGREFKIRNSATGKCLTYNVDGDIATPVWAESCDRDGQGWYRVTDSDGATKIVAVETNQMCLAAKDIFGGQRSGIWLWDCSSMIDNIHWDVI
jgi:Ricin-type beta-trefoil lectin domain